MQQTVRPSFPVRFRWSTGPTGDGPQNHLRILPAEEPGEIQVRGPTVFSEYWERPDDTEAAFTGDGWFRTGDTAVIEDDLYRILGRSSVDILKTGGEKVSALEIEEVLLGHEAVSEVAVVGVDDPEWGQRVVAVVVARHPVDPEELRHWAKGRLAAHKVPKVPLCRDPPPKRPGEDDETAGRGDDCRRPPGVR